MAGQRLGSFPSSHLCRRVPSLPTARGLPTQSSCGMPVGPYFCAFHSCVPGQVGKTNHELRPMRAFITGCPRPWPRTLTGPARVAFFPASCCCPPSGASSAAAGWLWLGCWSRLALRRLNDPEAERVTAHSSSQSPARKCMMAKQLLAASYIRGAAPAAWPLGACTWSAAAPPALPAPLLLQRRLLQPPACSCWRRASHPRSLQHAVVQQAAMSHSRDTQ